MLSACTGLRLEHLRQDSNSAELVVRLAGLFQMRLQVGSGVATATVQLAAGALPQLPESSRQLVADMAASQGQFQVNLAGAGATNLTAAMQVGMPAQLLCSNKRLSCGTGTAAKLLTCWSLRDIWFGRQLGNQHSSPTVTLLPLCRLPLPG